MTAKRDPCQMHMHGKGRHACKCVGKWNFSITVLCNHMRFDGIVAPNTSCLSLTLGPCSSFSLGVVCVCLSRLDQMYS